MIYIRAFITLQVRNWHGIQAYTGALAAMKRVDHNENRKTRSHQRDINLIAIVQLYDNTSRRGKQDTMVKITTDRTTNLSQCS